MSLRAAEGLKHPSFARCDELMNIRKSDLTNYVGSLLPAKTQELDRTLRVALVLD